MVACCGGLMCGVHRLRPVSLDVSCVARLGLCDGFVALAKSAYHTSAHGLVHNRRRDLKRA